MRYHALNARTAGPGRGDNGIQARRERGVRQQAAMEVKAAAFRLEALVLADAERIREKVALALWGISR